METITFNTITRYRQALSLLKLAAGSKDMRVELKTVMVDGIVNMYMTLENGVYAVVDAMLGSMEFDSIYVYFNDLYNFNNEAVEKFDEKSTTMWISDGHLYSGAMYNELTESFDLEYRFDMAEPFAMDMHIGDGEHIVLTQISVQNILSVAYGFQYVELYRKNGLLSYRTGCDNFTVATVMVSDSQNADSSASDFAIRMSTDVFKAAAAMGDVSGTVELVIDSGTAHVYVVSDWSKVSYAYEEPGYPSESAAGLSDFGTFMTEGMVRGLALVDAFAYLDRGVNVTVTAISDKQVEISLEHPGRYGIVVTRGECACAEGASITVPIDLLHMMFDKCDTKTVSIKYDPEQPGHVMACTGTGLFARKCISYVD